MHNPNKVLNAYRFTLHSLAGVIVNALPHTTPEIDAIMRTMHDELDELGRESNKALLSANSDLHKLANETFMRGLRSDSNRFDPTVAPSAEQALNRDIFIKILRNHFTSGGYGDGGRGYFTESSVNKDLVVYLDKVTQETKSGFYRDHTGQCVLVINHHGRFNDVMLIKPFDAYPEPNIVSYIASIDEYVMHQHYELIDKSVFEISLLNALELHGYKPPVAIPESDIIKLVNDHCSLSRLPMMVKFRYRYMTVVFTEEHEVKLLVKTDRGYAGPDNIVTEWAKLSPLEQNRLKDDLENKILKGD